MKTLTKTILLAATVLFMAACGSKTDKQAELKALKKQHDELAAKIKVLEDELKSTESVKTEKAIDVIATEAATSEFNHYIEVQGKVDGEDNIAVSSQTPGVVTSVLVKEGDRVSKGQVLATLDNSVLKQQQENLKTQLSFASNVFNKQKALWDKQIGSELQYLQAKNNKESLEANLAALNDQIEMTRIKSPINGSVEEVNLKVGQMSQPGMPAVRVVNFNSAKVIAEIAEAYAPKVKPGNKVIVSFPDFNENIETKINFTSKYINPVNRTFQAEVRLGPGKVDYRANMLAVVKINDYNNPKAIVFPVSVVRESSNGKYVYVVSDENGKTVARRREVILGTTYNGLVEIASGLAAGDKVITTGYNNLTDGQLVAASR